MSPETLSTALPGARKFTEMGITAKKEPVKLEQVERAARRVEVQDGSGD